MLSVASNSSTRSNRGCGKPDAPNHATTARETAPAEMLFLFSMVRSFSAKASYTFDGFHPRQFALLSDEAFKCLPDLVMSCEEMGEWPEAVRALTVALIPRAKGGTRPIAISLGYTDYGRGRDDPWETP